VSDELLDGWHPQSYSEYKSLQTVVTMRGQLYKKPAGKKKANPAVPLKLLILEMLKKE
jgi:hypothetical protein